jgi:hypothetical protein
MVADAVKHIIHTLIMLWLLQRHLQGLRGHNVTMTLLKSVAAAIITGLAAFGTAYFIQPLLPLDGFLIKLVLVFISGTAGVAGYSVMVLWLNLTEAKSLPKLLFRRRS